MTDGKKEKAEAKKPLTVYEAIAAVQGALAKEGIGKDRKNAQQNYSFRGIDDVYNALAPLLSESGLCILPRVLRRESVERTNKSGTVLFYVTVEVEFDFVSAGDGSKHTVKTFGEAMDSGDKATNKAMSAAYKYACLQAFCIPTEGDNDADATTHDVKPKGVFENAALRQIFIENTSMSFDKAESIASLKVIGVLARPTIEAMKSSGDSDDANGADKLRADYESRMKALLKDKPKTVEAAMAGGQA